jgi:hypothetical protein
VAGLILQSRGYGHTKFHYIGEIPSANVKINTIMRVFQYQLTCL